MKTKMAALIIGNADYVGGGVLKNPANDAADVSEKLNSYEFETIVVRDATYKEMDGKLKEFKKLLETVEVGLFFFAGHGMQIEGHNYLLAVDTDTDSEPDAKHSSLSLDKVIDVMEGSQAATKIIILDACRNNPWERRWNRALGARGLASVYAPKGTIIGFATSPGEIASDGAGRNGTYTEALLQHIDEPDLSIENMFKRVRNTVTADTHGKQTSWEHTSLSGDFYFNLSLSRLVTIYPKSSLADYDFDLDDEHPSHRIIKGLKSHDWYKQNGALRLLTSDSVVKMAEHNLFVLGRNIYQAGCGGANSAEKFMTSYAEKTSDYPKEKRKSILDGMLFEVFFNREAKLRSKIKGELFNKLFELQKHASLKSSFGFIADTLIASRGIFYTVPGKGHDLAVTIKMAKTNEGYRVDAVYIGGVDVLKAKLENWAHDDPAQRQYIEKNTADKFEEQLSQELIVPLRQLKITYKPAAAALGCILMPYGYSVRKTS